MMMTNKMTDAVRCLMSLFKIKHTQSKLILLLQSEDSDTKKTILGKMIKNITYHKNSYTQFKHKFTKN